MRVRLVCEVQDTGMGISEADRAELFTKFFRTPAARTATIPGIGLGLAITKQLAAANVLANAIAKAAIAKPHQAEYAWEGKGTS